MQWFDIDKQGLAKILARKGKAFAALELLQNAWDQDISGVAVWLEKAPGSRYATLTVIDDDPNGFSDLAHAFTLFAESEKKADATKRGRFNLGEKLVLALCDEARIRTVSGQVRFDKTGRHRSRHGTKVGSEFVGRLLMTHEELAESLDCLSRVLPPQHVATYINGRRLPLRQPLTSFEVTLPTEVGDEDGYLRRVQRKTMVTVYAVPAGRVGSLYEMGIPVVETDDSYDVDIAQKIPLSLERDNVSASYLRKVRTAVLNHLHEDLDATAASSAWVRDALADRNCEPEAARVPGR